MLSKKEIKDIQSLHLKKFREESGLLLAEGPKIVSELVTLVPHQIQTIYALPALLEEAKAWGFEKVVAISEAELDKISALQTPNGLVAVLRQFEVSEPDASNGFFIYLDTLQDPGNMGTVLRIADWFGVSGVICTPGCAEIYNPKVVQASMASIARVTVWQDDADLNWLKKQKAPVYAAALAGTSIYDFEKTDNGILIIGNESKGIRAELLAWASQKVTIPRRGGAESLNAGVATGILLSHLLS